MTTNKSTIALVYDFDGTLAKGNIPEHGIFKDLGIDKEHFWQETAAVTEENNCDMIFSYMYLLAVKAGQAGLKLTREKLAAYGKKNIPYFEGVTEWFARINAFCAAQGVSCEHYIISSGIEEVISATVIAPYFKYIFASKYHFSNQGPAECPSVMINYTTKTQYLFRINKGILNYHDNEAINRWLPMAARPVPFERIIYLGDGDTDIPSMKMTRNQGGHSIAVFDPDEWSDPSQQQKIYKLISEDRANYVAPADYRDGSQLDILVKGIIGKL
ncbi:MAG TPA: HAD family hydrolase, partial [Spirochaetota bacterium]|nr:HAD family hydrolase [Spirochaetota bacterium]